MKNNIKILFIILSSIMNICAEDYWAYFTTFDNKTDVNYKIYKYCGALEIAGSNNGIKFLPPYEDMWEGPILSIHPNTVGNVEILIKDFQLRGCIIKLVPDSEDEKYNIILIRPGIKSSGECGHRWMYGPHEFEAAVISNAKYDELISKSRSAVEKELIRKKIRYCGIYEGQLGLTLEPNGDITFLDVRNTVVIDKKFEFNGEANDKKN